MTETITQDQTTGAGDTTIKNSVLVEGVEGPYPSRKGSVNHKYIKGEVN